MQERAQRLRKLLVVQDQLKTMHEMRHAGFIAAAAVAGAEARDLIARFDAEDSLSALFPEIYHRGIADALARSDGNAALAAEEAKRVAVASARAGIIEREWRKARRAEDRSAEDRDRLELIASRAAIK